MGKFGEFVTQKRKEKNLTLRGFANAMQIAPSYASDIEKGNRKPDKKEILERIANVLTLSEEDKAKLFDLAAEEQNTPTAPQDISEYVASDKMARVALRTAKTYNATEKDWREFIEKLKEKNNG